MFKNYQRSSVATDGLFARTGDIELDFKNDEDLRRLSVILSKFQTNGKTNNTMELNGFEMEPQGGERISKISMVNTSYRQMEQKISKTEQIDDTEMNELIRRANEMQEKYEIKKSNESNNRSRFKLDESDKSFDGVSTLKRGNNRNEGILKGRKRRNDIQHTANQREKTEFGKMIDQRFEKSALDTRIFVKSRLKMIIDSILRNIKEGQRSVNEEPAVDLLDKYTNTDFRSNFRSRNDLSLKIQNASQSNFTASMMKLSTRFPRSVEANKSTSDYSRKRSKILETTTNLLDSYGDFLSKKDGDQKEFAQEKPIESENKEQNDEPEVVFKNKKVTSNVIESEDLRSEKTSLKKLSSIKSMEATELKKKSFFNLKNDLIEMLDSQKKIHLATEKNSRKESDKEIIIKHKTITNNTLEKVIEQESEKEITKIDKKFQNSYFKMFGQKHKDAFSNKNKLGHCYTFEQKKMNQINEKTNEQEIVDCLRLLLPKKDVVQKLSKEQSKKQLPIYNKSQDNVFYQKFSFSEAPSTKLISFKNDLNDQQMVHASLSPKLKQKGIIKDQPRNSSFAISEVDYTNTSAHMRRGNSGLSAQLNVEFSENPILRFATICKRITIYEAKLEQLKESLFSQNHKNLTLLITNYGNIDSGFLKFNSFKAFLKDLEVQLNEKNTMQLSQYIKDFFKVEQEITQSNELLLSEFGQFVLPRKQAQKFKIDYQNQSYKMHSSELIEVEEFSLMKKILLLTVKMVEDLGKLIRPIDEEMQTDFFDQIRQEDDAIDQKKILGLMQSSGSIIQPEHIGFVWRIFKVRIHEISTKSLTVFSSLHHF